MLLDRLLPMKMHPTHDRLLLLTTHYHHQSQTQNRKTPRQIQNRRTQNRRTQSRKTPHQIQTRGLQTLRLQIQTQNRSPLGDLGRNQLLHRLPRHLRLRPPMPRLQPIDLDLAQMTSLHPSQAAPRVALKVLRASLST